MRDETEATALRRREVETKQRRIEEMLQSLKLDGVILTRRANFAWMTAGGDNHVGLATEIGNASLLVEPGRWTLIATNIETPRVAREELEGVAPRGNLDVEAVPWHLGVEPAIERLVHGRRIASDTGIAGTPNVQAALAGLRFPLTAEEVQRLRRVGALSRDALEQVLATEVAPGMTELEVAGRMTRALWERGLEGTVVLVAADDRIRQYRHPIPTGRAVERYLMGVICARQGGLIAALTRLVHFGRIPGDLRARHEAVCHVDAALMDATRPGARVADILLAGQEAYRRHGYPDEWKLHHQGGAIAYAEREYLATPQSVQVVKAPGAFAWNPSITGTKSEDTILVGAADGPDPGRVEIITAHGPSWPGVEVEAGGRRWVRPGILELAMPGTTR
ncbi:M24 family metallopeptidase [Carboxydochorda subterranea]|uniref:M24 family metallopeptidase n=1 Tax=Carboxydichorda subterranea TaxID=3109565 RepID=A0ABZ1C022_9FIRM|nr:M24 family metallopeptidase [Limnochorda sp. L945t]WRP18180.1 M24 family metallopeptidase [Limnochorda sp. L945t]